VSDQENKESNDETEDIPVPKHPAKTLFDHLQKEIQTALSYDDEIQFVQVNMVVKGRPASLVVVNEAITANSSAVTALWLAANKEGYQLFEANVQGQLQKLTTEVMRARSSEAALLNPPKAKKAAKKTAKKTVKKRPTKKRSTKRPPRRSK